MVGSNDVVAKVESRLQKKDGRPDFNLEFYLIGKDGTRLGDCGALHTKEKK